MAEVKIFKVKGEILKPGYKTSFSKEIRAVRPEDAIEKIYSELGGQHRIKRVHLMILSVEEMSLEEVENPLVKSLSVE